MKKLFALLLTLGLMATMVISASAASVVTNDTTFIKNGPGYLAIDENGVVSTKTLPDNNNTVWAALETKDFETNIGGGFKMEITDIEWDAENNPAVTIVVGDIGSNTGRTWLTTKQAVVLVVQKNGTVTFYNVGVDNYFGDRTVYDDTVLEAGATSFTYSMVPSADLTSYTFYVNDTAIAVYDDTNSKNWPGMLDRLPAMHFGVGVIDGNDFETGCVLGTIEFKLASLTMPETVVVGDKVVAFGNAGDEVTVTAPSAEEGMLFTGWTAEGVTLTDATAATQTFAMPEGGAKLTPNYEEDPSYTPPTTDEPTTDEPTTEEPTDTPDNSNEGTTEPAGTNKPADKDDDKGGLHPAIIAVIAVAVVAVVVVVIVVAKKKK